jgi:hypothetical protein
MTRIDRPTDDTWIAYAPCRSTDPEAFFPLPGGQARDAKDVCGSCAFRLPCLLRAIDLHVRDGIWAGLNMADPAQRRQARAVADLSGIWDIDAAGDAA